MGATGAPLLINRLSRILGERRMTAKELSDGSGISYRAVLDLYHARSTRVDLETINRLCNFLRVSPNDIFEWQPDPPTDGGEPKAA